MPVILARNHPFGEGPTVAENNARLTIGVHDRLARQSDFIGMNSLQRFLHNPERADSIGAVQPQTQTPQKTAVL